MSSTAFEVVLRPDRTLFHFVAGSGMVLMTLGIILIMPMQIAPIWRIFLASIWVAECLREQRNIRLGAARIRSLRLDSHGIVVATDFAGNHDEPVLLTGTIVLPSVAWFRLRFSDSKQHMVLFTRKRSEAAQWHRLQLLWQQANEVFGHRPGP